MGIPWVEQGNDLASTIMRSVSLGGIELQDGDIFVVKQNLRRQAEDSLESRRKAGKTEFGEAKPPSPDSCEKHGERPKNGAARLERAQVDSQGRLWSHRSRDEARLHLRKSWD